MDLNISMFVTAIIMGAKIVWRDSRNWLIIMRLFWGMARSPRSCYSDWQTNVLKHYLISDMLLQNIIVVGSLLRSVTIMQRYGYSEIKN